MRTTTRRALVPLVALALLGAACTSDDNDDAGGDTTPDGTEAPDETSAPDGTDAPDDTVEVVQGDESTLDAVIANDVIRCGTRDALPGFAVLTPEGDHVGFDSDYCRVIAAAVLGDSEKVDMVDLETADRFTALQSGEIDVLVRNTTWIAARDGNEGATFLTPTLYDGQGIMVAADSGFTTITDLDNVIVCVAQGTTTEGNAANEATRLGLTWTVKPYADTDLIQEAFVAGQCDAWSADSTQLVALRSVYPDGPEALTIFPDLFSKEPLAAAVADGDTEWAQAVNWAILATIQAEEFGIDSTNVDSFSTSTDPAIRGFLGLEVDGDDGAAVLDPGLGLPTDFAFQVVSQVGNYGEIFAEHLAPLGLERGLNSLWTDGGLLYSPPYR